LNNIGVDYTGLGQERKALEYHDQALSLSRAVGNQAGEAFALNDIGLLYWTLGEQQKALEDYEQSLELFRTLRDQLGVATTLNNIGKVYSDLGDRRKALEYYDQALPLLHAVGAGSSSTSEISRQGQAGQSPSRRLPLSKAPHARHRLGPGAL